MASLFRGASALAATFDAFDGRAFSRIAGRDFALERFNDADLRAAALNLAQSDYTAQASGVTDTMLLRCGCASCFASTNGKDFTAFFADGVGDKIPTPRIDNVAIADAEPGGASTTLTVQVDGAHVYATINDFNDQDFFRVELVAGQTYQIGQYLITDGAARGLSGVALADAYLELFASDGTTLLAQADGGGPNTPSGLDALLTFTATTTGTYYINARSYDQDATNGTKGDHVGDYQLFVDSVDASQAPLPRFYGNDELLASLDWGTQWNRTSRNPDGNNGTRTDNGVPNGGAVVNESTYGISGKNVLTFYFAKQGDLFTSHNPTNPGLENMLQVRDLQSWEKEAFLNMFAEYEKVADLEFIQVTDRAKADIKLVVYNGTPGVGPSVLGRMSPPGEQNEGQMEINGGDVRWTEAGVKPGGFYFPTLLHELGHGMGMKHPHDTGGGGPTMRGATAGQGQVIGGAYGDFGLSQGIYTMMSYNDGWDETGQVGGRPAGHGGPRTSGSTGTDHFGHIGTMAALDIAVIQDKYGVNEEHATGNDTYVIADQNGPGVYYRTIWDGGGTDLITYTGARNATIDLRAATLKYEEGGGGRVSYALGAWSGFTIANGVTIENATSGSGNDELIGNDAANVLIGNGGNDVLRGGAGDDRLSGGTGNDFLDGGAGNDVINGGTGVDTVSYASSAAGVTVMLSVTTTQNTGGAGRDQLISMENIRGSSYADDLRGNSGANRIEGGSGSDRIEGGGGGDTLTGEAGRDRFVFTSVSDSQPGAPDRITDLEVGDIIDLSRIDANGAASGDGAFTRIGNADAFTAAGQLRLSQRGSDTLLELNTDSDADAEMLILLTGNFTSPTAHDGWLL